MPPTDIRSQYDDLKIWRDEFLENAQKTAELTMPWLRPDGTRITERPWTQLGTQAVRSLTATVHKILFPPSTKWLKLGIPADKRMPIQMELEKVAVEDPEEASAMMEQINRTFEELEDVVIAHLAGLKSRSRIASAILRNLIEGNTALFVDETSLRVFPLRNFVCFRESGEPILLITREEYVEKVAEEDSGGSGNTREHEDRNWLYTYVDYREDEVWQQTFPRKSEPGPVVQVEASTLQWFVFNGHVPDVEHYSESYTFEAWALINEINHLTERLSEAAATAAWNLPIVREGSTLTVDMISDRPSGQPLVGNADDLQWVTSGVKIGEWSFVGAYRQQLREELASTFALGIKDQVRPNATATEILQVVNELDSHTQDLLTAYEETLQRPMIRAILAIHGLDKSVDVPGVEEAISIMITTGTNALQREQSMMRTIQVATAVKELDPTMTIDGPRMMDRAGAAMQFDTEGLFGRAQAPEEGQPQAGIGEPTANGGPQPQQPAVRPAGPA